MRNKKPMTTYFLFRESMKNDLRVKSLSPREKSSCLWTIYKGMSNEARQVYKDKYIADMKAYNGAIPKRTTFSRSRLVN
jgi:hypothetical protein